MNFTPDPLNKWRKNALKTLRELRKNYIKATSNLQDAVQALDIAKNINNKKTTFIHYENGRTKKKTAKQHATYYGTPHTQ